MGPLLILNIFRNNLKYQIVAIIVMLAIVIWSLIVSREHELLLWFSLVFIVGAQFMAVMVERGRIVLERAKFISEINNKKLTKYLSQEIAEKTKAQEKAKDEEEKRTQFTNMLFHEMRVLLNSVILSLNDLEADDSLKGNIGDDAVENMERINSGLNAIINIINDSLDLRKMTQGKLQIVTKPFGYHQMIIEVVRSMESSWKSKDVKFIMSLDAAVNSLGYKVLGDSNRLRQVVANYISNAVKFTPPGGSVALKTVLEERKNSHVWIYTEVQDSGVGIRKEDIKKLFNPFVQIDPEKLQGGKGSGLGLSIVASIISSMGGTYGVRSDYGKGSTFWFKVRFNVTDIPIDVKVEAEPKTNLPEITQRYHILVTDDDGNTRKIMRKLLERLGHTTDGAEDGIDCIEKVALSEETGTPYDVVFLDNQMPRMDGLEALGILKERFSIPVIMLTGSSEATTLQKFKNLGANEVLLKPATLTMINDTLRKVM